MLRLIILLIVIITAVLAFTACSMPERLVYKEVFVPVKCDVKERVRPKQKSNALLYLKEVLIYSEGLEADLAYCRGVNNTVKPK